MAGQFDSIIVGSGINGLVCAATLARKGHTVCLIEREAELGGCLKSGEVTLPGYIHDKLAGFHPLFVTSPGYRELGAELHARGLTYGNDAHPTGVVMGDGRSLIMERSRDANVTRFNGLSAGDGDKFAGAMHQVDQNADLIFSLLGNDLWTGTMAGKLLKEAWTRGPSGLAGFFGAAMPSCRDWLSTDFKSDLVRALLAPWVLHTGLGPDQTLSGLMNQVIAFTLEAAGMPVVVGGAGNFVAAFERLILDHGGIVKRSTTIDEVQVENGRAVAVRTTDGQSFVAGKGVFCSVTPDALYNGLLRRVALPEAVRHQAGAFRHGRAAMQIHLALDGSPGWTDPALLNTAMVHICDGTDDVSRAVAQSTAGLLPDRPTIVVGQPTANDPSRVPKGKGLLWLQLQELPRVITGDAMGQIDIGPGGKWTSEISAAYADRVVKRLCAHVPGLEQLILKRRVLAPPDLEAMNRNLVGGDPYGGDCGLDQSFLWRPLRATKNHRTPIRNLFHIGASTHPGPGLGGGSGYIAAKYF